MLKLKEKYDNAYSQLEQAEKRLEDERKKATQNDEKTEEKEKELHKLEVIQGLTEVNGKGVIITVEDSNLDNSQILDLNKAMVHDGDLIEIVNILKNAGAEAISINDQRIVNTTAITCDGMVVRINGEKIGVPFEIKAIGLPEAIKGALDKHQYIIQMIEDGVKVDIKKSNNIKIVKYEGVTENTYLKDR